MWHESQELLEQFVGTELQDTTDSLGDEQRRELWQLFVAIHDTWGSDAARPEEMDSRWREFIHEKCVHSPSYLPVYRLACRLFGQLRRVHGAQMYDYLFFDPEVSADPLTELYRVKKLVVDEFIRVYVSSGGFRAYGGKNYGGFVSGSRFRSQRPYRTFEGKQ